MSNSEIVHEQDPGSLLMYMHVTEVLHSSGRWSTLALYKIVCTDYNHIEMSPDTNNYLTLQI